MLSAKNIYPACYAFNPLTSNHNNCRLLCHLLVILKVIFAKKCGPRSDCSSDQGLHGLPVCKDRFEKFARIFSRRHKQTFSDAGFLGILRVNSVCKGVHVRIFNSDRDSILKEMCYSFLHILCWLLFLY